MAGEKMDASHLLSAISFPLVTNDVITHDVILNPAKGRVKDPTSPSPNDAVNKTHRNVVAR